MTLTHVSIGSAMNIREHIKCNGTGFLTGNLCYLNVYVIKFMVKTEKMVSLQSDFQCNERHWPDNIVDIFQLLNTGQ